MEYWLDTTQISLITLAKSLGILHGVTTNPMLLSTSNLPPLTTLEKLLEAQEGPVTAQVTALNHRDMIIQARHLKKLSPRLIIKIPVTQEGLIAIKTLKAEKFTLMATVVYDPIQALLAMQAGASYVAVYIGRMEDAAIDPYHVLSTIQKFFKNTSSCKLMGASLRSDKHLHMCLELGISSVTLRDKLFHTLITDHPLTLQNSQEFSHLLPENWTFSGSFYT